MAARLVDIHEAFQMICKSSKKWGLMITPNFHYNNLDEVYKAAPYMDPKNFPKKFKYKGEDNAPQVMGDGFGFFLFDTEIEMEYYYQSTVGDDGPMARNKYDGPARVYALTCDPTGTLMNENT